MKLPALPFLKQKPQSECFIALILKPRAVTSVLLQNNPTGIHTLATKSVALDFDRATTEEVIAACDEAISSTEMSLPEGYKLEKTIFAVPYSWSDTEGNITHDKLLQLKKISVELALKPMGFIITVEAIINALEKKDGAPITGIFVEESKSKVYLYLVKANTIREVQQGELGDTAVEKVVEHTLKKVEKFETLPTKMILLHNDDLKERQQEFLSHDWSHLLPFLHPPQISLLEKGFENEAVIQGIASQFKAEVTSAKGVIAPEVVEGEGSHVAKGENFGFQQEHDVASDSENAKDTAVMDADDADEIEERREEEVSEAPRKRGASAAGGILGMVTSLPTKIAAALPLIGGSSSRLKLLAIPIFATTFFILLMVGYYFVFLRAEVVVFTEGETLDDSVLVTLSESDATSFDDEILHIDTIEEEVEGEVSATTTGVEEVGEEATGEVTIFNKGDQEVTLSEGTVLTSSNNLKFTLDSEVKIASTSSFSTDISNKKVSVTADEFGKEYNLPSNTNFTIEGINTSDGFAKNDTAFAGGTKEEKQVVSSKDIGGLEAELLEQLQEKAVASAKGKTGDGEEVISIVLGSELSGETYSAEVGDEVSEVALSGTAIYTLGVYKTEEAKKFIDDARQDTVPDEFQLSEDDSEIELTEIEEDDEVITARLNYKALFKPEVDLSSIAERITGKGVGSAEEALQEIEGVTDITVNFKNKLPLLPSILPARAEQIEIVFRTENS